MEWSRSLWEKVLHRKREEAISKGNRSLFGMAELALHIGRHEKRLF